MITAPADNGKAMAWGLAYTLAFMYALMVGYLVITIDWFSILSPVAAIPAIGGVAWVGRKMRKIEDESNH